MLPRPGVLLNPSDRGDTHFDADPTLAAAEAQDYAEMDARKLRQQRALERADDMVDVQSNCLQASGLYDREEASHDLSRNKRVMPESYGLGYTERGQVECQMDLCEASYQRRSVAGRIVRGVVGMFTSRELDRGSCSGRAMPTLSAAAARAQHASIEFLRSGSRRWWNLRPDASGAVRIPRSDIPASHSSLVVLAVDAAGNKVWQRVGLSALQPQAASVPASSASVAASPTSIASASSSNSASPEEAAADPADDLSISPCYRDLRLSPALDPAKHFQQRLVSTLLLRRGEALSVANINDSAVEVYSSMEGSCVPLPNPSVAPRPPRSSTASPGWFAGPK